MIVTAKNDLFEIVLDVSIKSVEENPKGKEAMKGVLFDMLRAQGFTFSQITIKDKSDEN